MDQCDLDVIVFGSASIDFTCYVERLPKAGETLHGYEFVTGFGGKGANQCVAAARLGARTGVIARLGDDLWGNDYLKQMKKENINTNHTKQCKNTTTGVAQIAVSKNGDNSIIIVLGANSKLTKEDVWSAKTWFETGKILLCQLESPIEATLEALCSFKGISILNAAPAMTDIPLDLVKNSTILCVNEHEAAQLTKNTDIQTLEQAKSAAMQLMQLGCKCAIVTLGSQGALYVREDEPNICVHVLACKVDNVTDTTGAGDAFIGALSYHMLFYPKESFHQHVGFACYAAAYSVQYKGAQCSFPYIKDMQHLLNTQFPCNFI